MDAGPAILVEPPVARPVPAKVEAHYGGPDQPARALRDLLKAQIEAAPPGSEILWATYYFRDRGLADALVAAHHRGVRVRVVLDGQPRRRNANDAVISKLRRGLGPGLRIHRPFVPGGRLHTKIYAFSGPSPRVFVGSFNPSGDEPDDPAVLADIGDQDRGHNLLVELRDAAVVSEVRAQADRIWRGPSFWDFAVRPPVGAGAVQLFFYPRLRPEVVETSLDGLDRGDSVRAAISHVEPGPLTARLSAAARRGADVELVVHDTERRVPSRLVASLKRAGVDVRRYCHPDGLPMHAKFVLVERDGRRTAWFGSLNFNFNSRFLNQEILVRSRDPVLVADLGERFELIRQEAIALAAAQETPGAPQVQRAAFTASTAGGDGGIRVVPLTRACEGPSASEAAPSVWFSALVAQLRSRWVALVRWVRALGGPFRDVSV